MRWLVQILVRSALWAAYRAYRAEGISALLILLPAKFIVPTLRKHGAHIGERVECHSPLIIHNASPNPGQHYVHLAIGDDCYIGRQVFFDLKDDVVVEDRVTISMRVTLVTHTDVGKSPLAGRIPPTQAPVRLRRGAYIGAGATILQGVEVGEEAMVGAGAVVLANVPAHSVAVGVPARILESAEQTSRHPFPRPSERRGPELVEKLL